MNGSYTWWRCTTDAALRGLLCRRKDLLCKMAPSFLELYAGIIEKVPETNVAMEEGEDFRNEFRKFFVPKKAQEVFSGFSSQYFVLMQWGKKNKPSISFDPVLHALFKASGQVQRSFASKLVHVIKQDKPILDQNVERALCFDDEMYESSNYSSRATRRSSSTASTNKMRAARKVYRALESLTRDIVRQEGFGELVAAFDDKFPEFDHFTPMKKLDFYLWAYGQPSD